MKSSDIGADFAAWESFSQSGIIDELYSMYDYVDFLCKWNEYFVKSYTDSNGQFHQGYYLYAEDAINYLEKGNMSYGTRAGYFEGLIAQIQAIDKTAFGDLVLNIQEAKALAEKAYAKLYNKEYTSEYKYVDKFSTYDYIYSINGGVELKAELELVFDGFQEWLAGWEL